MNNSSSITPPRRNELPVIRKLIDAYKLWYAFLPHIPKTSRYTLGEKIGVLFVECVEDIYSAIYVKPTERLAFVICGAKKIDTLKFLLQILWETKQIDTKKYITLSEKLDEIGRMLGGWIKQLLQRKTPI